MYLKSEPARKIAARDVHADVAPVEGGEDGALELTRPAFFLGDGDDGDRDYHPKIIN